MTAERELRNAPPADELGNEVSELQAPTNGAKGTILRENLATGFCVALLVVGGAVCLVLNFHLL